MHGINIYENMSHLSPVSMSDAIRSNRSQHTQRDTYVSCALNLYEADVYVNDKVARQKTYTLCIAHSTTNLWCNFDMIILMQSSFRASFKITCTASSAGKNQ